MTSLAAATLIDIYSQAVAAAEEAQRNLKETVAEIKASGPVDQTTGPRINAAQGAFSLSLKAITEQLRGKRVAAAAAVASVPESEQDIVGETIDDLERAWSRASRQAAISSILGL